MWGKLLVVASTVAYGFWGFALKKASASMHPLLVQTFVALTGVALIVFYAATAHFSKVELKVDAPGMFWAVMAGAASGLAAIALLYGMAKGVDAGSAIAMTAAYPAITSALAVVFLGESLSLEKVAGIAAIGVGAVLLSR